MTCRLATFVTLMLATHTVANRNPCEAGAVCHNGGTCVSNGSQARCVCVEGFIGPHCLTRQNMTDSLHSRPPPQTQELAARVSLKRSQMSGGNDRCHIRDSSKHCWEGMVCKNGTWSCKPDWVGPTCCHTCNNTCLGTGYCAERLTKIHGITVYRAVCACPAFQTHVDGTGCVSRCVFNSSLHYCPKDTSALYLGLGVTSGLCVLFLFVFSLLVYFLWRRRVLWAQKLVYLFLPYQDDPDKADAYISYCESGSGNQFVCTRLLPKLEDELKYKLLVHHRDFELGRPHQDNIIEAIESSARVILVLTRDFVNSEWQLLESHAAFHQMIKMKTRIIPILLEDVRKDPNLQPGLKYLLSSVTCLHAPNSSDNPSSVSWQRFWKRLHYCMPKLRSKTSVESRFTSCLRHRYPQSDYPNDHGQTMSAETPPQTREAALSSSDNMNQQEEQPDLKCGRSDLYTGIHPFDIC